MLMTLYRFYVLLNVFNCAAALHNLLTTDSVEQNEDFSRRSPANQPTRQTNKPTLLPRPTSLESLERSPVSWIDFVASEMRGSMYGRRRRRNRDGDPNAAIAGETGTIAREDVTASSQVLVASSSTLEGLVTRHWKHRRRRRCKNRLGCARFGNHDSASASAIVNEENVDETKTERPNDNRPIYQQSARDRNLEKRFLVENRSTALFRQGLAPVVAAGEDPSSIDIGDILADARTRRPQLAPGSPPPKISLKRTEKQANRTAVTTRDSDDGITITVTKYEKRRQNVEPEMNETLARLNDLDDTIRRKSLNATRNRTEQYGNLQYQFDSSVDTKEDHDRSKIERKYESGREAHSRANGNRDLLESAVLASIYLPIDGHMDIHESLAALLGRLFDTLKNTTAMKKSRVILEDLDATSDWLDGENSAEDLCQKWLDSKDKLENAFLGSRAYLPACPCQYPSSIFYDDNIWDEKQQKYFRWRDVHGDAERMDVYKPGATYCIRSLLSQDSGHAAAQHCCYDRQRRLLTRGSGAGTPNFVSPEISTALHERIDILPWRLCRGDFSRFNEVRPPNNGNRCKTNPDDDDYRRQIENTKYY